MQSVLKKHHILESIVIEKLIFGGMGLALAPDGRKIIVSGGAIPKATVNLRILKVKKHHIEAQVIETVIPSPLERDIPEKWQVYGGCKWLPLPYTEQLRIKSSQIKEAFHGLPHILTDATFHPIIPAVESEHYRNKVEFSWGKYISAREGIHDEYRFGFHLPGAFDRIENCRYCVLADDEINAIFYTVDAIARSSQLSTYDPKTQQGFWRHLVIRKAKKTGQIMVIFSVNAHYPDDPNIPAISHFWTDIVRQLSEKHTSIVSIYCLQNTGKADIVQGEAHLLWGSPVITDKIGDMKFDIRPKSFFQVNTLTAERLYQTVAEYIHHKGGVLFDLYAGTGTIGILLAPHFSRVYSVEYSESASRDGTINAQKNSLKHIDFIHAKVEDFAREAFARGERADTLVVDPPRDGLHPSAIPNLLGFSAKEIIYVSCNPATLVRDLRLMLAGDLPPEITSRYRITDIIPVDMFPHTHHIETVVRLEKI